MKKYNLEITPKLKLLYVDQYNADEELISVSCTFSFHNEWGNVIVMVEDFDQEVANYPLIEGGGELHSSFSEALDEHWLKILDQCKDYLKVWNENFKS